MTSPTNAEKLSQVQRHGRSPEQDRDNLVQELLTLARVLHQNPDVDGINLGALGGLQYCIERLHEAFQGKMSLDQLKQRYAEVELTSFPVSEEEVESMREWSRQNGIVLRDIPVTTGDGVTRHILASHLRQTTYDGWALQEGELVHNRARFPPPFSSLLPKS